MATGAPIDRLRAYVAHDDEAAAVLERHLRLPALTTDLKTAILETLTELRAEWRAAPWARRGPAGKNLLAAIDRAMKFLPPPAPAETPDQVRERLRELDAEAIAKIEGVLPDRIDPKETQ